jgi:SRSO17 transposase
MIEESEQLRHFVYEMLRSLPRRDQRVRGYRYVTGLLRTSSQKWVRDEVRHDDVAAQSLHHFVNDSTWDWSPVRRQLAMHLSLNSSTFAWSIDRYLFPKTGQAAVGTHRRHLDGYGHITCQVGVALQFMTDGGNCPVNWRLYMPSTWDISAARRLAARIPHKVSHRPMSHLALELIDELATWQLRPPLVVVGALDEPTGALVAGLQQRRIPHQMREVDDVVSTSWTEGVPNGRLKTLPSVSLSQWSSDQHMLYDLGLTHFMGRSYPGWHRHVTLVSLACGYLVDGGHTDDFE